MQIIRLVGFVIPLYHLILACGAQGHPNPRYFTTKPSSADERTDTLVILEAIPQPSYLKPSHLNITYIVPMAAADSLQIFLESGQICQCRWDKYVHTWRGNFRAGDTLSCSFEFTPLTVGDIQFVLRVRHDTALWNELPFAFTLNENGQPVDAELYAADRYGQLGVAPSIVPDTLYFWRMCYLDKFHRSAKQFYVSAKLYPKLAKDRDSKVVFTFVPTVNLDLGAVYVLEYTDNLAVSWDDSADWSGLVQAGDSLQVAATIRPLRPGFAGIYFSAHGYSSDGSGIAHHYANGIGKIGGALDVGFVLDQSLSPIAYKEGAGLRPEHFKMHQTGWVDAYRLQQTDLLVGETQRLQIQSRNYMAKEAEFEQQRAK